MILLFLMALIAVAQKCPDTKLGKPIREIFVVTPARWLEDMTWKRALLGAAVFIVLIAMASTAPELALLSAGLDMSLLIELAAATALVAARLRLDAVTTIVKALPGRLNRIRKHVQRPRTARTPAKPRGTKAKADDEPGLAFA